MDEFAHLHVHTEYSILKGVGDVESIHEAAKKRGITAVALTESGGMGSALASYIQSKESGVKHIFGVQAQYVRTVKAPSREEPIVLLAKSEKGYSNLLKLFKFSWDKGFDKTRLVPKVDIKRLKKYAEGLVCLTGSLTGPIAMAIGVDYQAASRAVQEMKDIFGNNLYLEIQFNEFEEQKRLNRVLMELAKEHGLETVLTTDCHYVKTKEWKLSETVLNIDKGRARHNRQYDRVSKYKSLASLKTLEKWRRKEHAYITAAMFRRMVSTTLSVAGDCNVDIPIGKHSIPQYDVESHPLFEKGMDGEFDLFKKIAEQGFKKKIRKDKNRRKKRGTYRKRFDYEIDIIRRANFINYFLIVEDIIRAAKANGVEVGAARGCLLGDNQIVCKNGVTKPIKEIKSGEFVHTKSGDLREVLETFEYPVKEEIVRFKTYYGSYSENGYTSDHKIFGQKCRRPLGYGNWSENTRRSRKCTLEPIRGRIEEIKAGDLRKDDWIWTPFVQRQETEDFIFHFDKFMDDYNLLDGGVIIENVPVNHPYPLSVREVSKEADISRNFIRNWLSGADMRTERQFGAQRKLISYLNDKGMPPEEWGAYLDEMSLDVQTVPKSLVVDKEAAWVIGRWIADGWTIAGESRSRTWSICTGPTKADDYHRIINWLDGLGVRHNTRTLDNGVKTIDVNCGVFTRCWTNLFKNYKHHASTKYVPDRIKKLNNELLTEVVNGMMDGDGHHRKEYSSYSTVSERLANDLRYIFSLLKTPAAIGARFDPRNYTNDYEYTVRYRKKVSQGLTGSHRCYVQNNGYFSKVREVDSELLDTNVYDLHVDTQHSYLTSNGAVHNSVAGSLTAFCMDITDVDPLDYDLMFERFLNPTRISGERAQSADALPDIDLDFEKLGRPWVKQYIIDKYGENSVCTIGSFSTMHVRTLLRDLFKVFEEQIPVDENTLRPWPKDEFYELVRDLEKEDIDELEDAKKKSEVFKRFAEKNKYFVEYYLDGLDGQIRGMARHAAAVLVTPSKLTDWIPVRTMKEVGDTKADAGRVFVSDWEDVYCERRGLLKLDILGIKTLNVFKKSKELIKARHGIEVDLTTVPLNDKKVFKEFAKGNTTGVFQYGSKLQSEFLAELDSVNLEDLITANALLRPGPMDADAHKLFIQLKRGEIDPSYDHPMLEEFLARTFGLYVYQEDVMRTAHVLGKLSLSEADIMRTAMKKHDRQQMEEFRAKFVDGARQNGLSKKKANKVWDKLLAFFAYGFNRCIHADSRVRLADDKELTVLGLFHRFQKGQEIWLKSYDQSAGKVVEHKVKRVVKTGKKRLCHLTMDNGRSLSCTTFHGIGTHRGFRRATDVRFNDDILAYPDGSNEVDLCTLVRQKCFYDENYRWTTFDIEMDGEPRNYFADGILVHNSHSASYALIGYFCQWFKVNFPLEFWASTLEQAKRDKKARENIWTFRKHIIELGYKFEDAWAMRGDSSFHISEDDRIVWPVKTFEGIGDKTADLIAEACAEHQPETLGEFFEKVPKRNVNKRVFDRLIAGGAFDRLGTPREVAEEYYLKLRKDKALPEAFDVDPKNKEYWEEMKEEVLGYMPSPIRWRYGKWFSSAITPISKIAEKSEGEYLIAGGKVKRIYQHKSHAGTMYFVTMMDSDGEITVFFAPGFVRKGNPIPEVNDIIEVCGQRDVSNRGEVQIVLFGDKSCQVEIMGDED